MRCLAWPGQSQVIASPWRGYMAGPWLGYGLALGSDLGDHEPMARNQAQPIAGHAMTRLAPSEANVFLENPMICCY